jgi:protein-L-isoaspartate(D-aspartate) O-methyltransferase
MGGTDAADAGYKAGGDVQAVRRRRMVAEQLVARGISDEAVLEAMLAVPRELFVPPAMERHAYEDGALSIGRGQTISQPYIVALMTELLQLHAGSRVLEVGTGSGYQAAVAARIAAEVWSVERLAYLHDRAAALLATLKVHNVHLLVADGRLGWPEQAPYDAVIVTAATQQAPPALLAQLAEGGRLVVPLGAASSTQILTAITRRGNEFRSEAGIPCRFVPLIEGDEAASSDPQDE